MNNSAKRFVLSPLKERECERVWEEDREKDRARERGRKSAEREKREKIA